MVKAFPIDPDAIYDDGPLVIDLGMRGSSLARARRSGALRYTRKGGRVLYLGRWILDWLEEEQSPGSPIREEVAAC